MISPVLYSFRRCPYAMRARLAIDSAQVLVETREILLRDKPQEMLEASEKGTVPVLVLPSGEVIDESLDIMFWALSKNDPNNLLDERYLEIGKILIQKNDLSFKANLDKYKYWVRFPEKSEQEYRQNCEIFLVELERHLSQNKFLLSKKQTIADVAIFPFIRQFAFVNKAWFDASPYKSLKIWLGSNLDSEEFHRIMVKQKVWESELANLKE